jgi:hypothetical protein
VFRAWGRTLRKTFRSIVKYFVRFASVDELKEELRSRNGVVGVNVVTADDLELMQTQCHDLMIQAQSFLEERVLH